jgi:GNAT superfamily N-acetyltransferase
MDIVYRFGAEGLDPAAVHALLADTYWFRNRTMDQVARTLRNSFVITAWSGPRLVGFARLITDFTVHAYLADVVIAADVRGGGIGSRMVRKLVDHEAVATCQIHLHTKDAHEVYRRLGFAAREGMSRPRRIGGGWRPAGRSQARAEVVDAIAAFAEQPAVTPGSAAPPVAAAAAAPAAVPAAPTPSASAVHRDEATDTDLAGFYRRSMAKILGEAAPDRHAEVFVPSGIADCDARVATAEMRLGHHLPRALTVYYAVAGEHWLTTHHNRLLLPEELYHHEGHLVIMEENRVQAVWGVGRAAFSATGAAADPEVSIRVDAWYGEGLGISRFLMKMWNFQVHGREREP